MWIETHAHLCDSQFDADREDVLARARAGGVGAIVEIADSPDGWKSAEKLAEQNVDVYWTCGFHPHYADLQEKFDFNAMALAARHERCVAVGEIGLDYVKSRVSKEDQEACFRKSLETADLVGKPVVIHCREAQADTLRILKSFFGGLSGAHLSAGVIHCFSGDLSFAEGCLELGFFLGVDGPVTYPGAKLLREVVARVPLERIVLETDCPYLPPQDFRGQRNEPAYIGHIARKLSEVYNVSPEEISKTTTQNAMKLYRLKGLQ